MMAPPAAGPSDNMLAAALAIAAGGVPVFPCRPIDKRPMVATGFKAATTDETVITSWWGRWPDAMIAMPTGAPSGIIVLDIDRDNGKGLDGFAALAELEAAHDALPETRVQRTPRGEHRFLAWPGYRIANSASKLGIGIDVRGDGGYVILAPSVNADGVAYELTRDLAPVAAPPWLLALVRGHKSGDSMPAGGRQQDQASRYAAAALADECREVACAVAGRRNEQLNRSAFSLGQLVGAGALDRDRVEAALLEAATASGLLAEDGEASVRRTIRSGLYAGIADPREIPPAGARSKDRPRGRQGSVSDLGGFAQTEDGVALAFATKLANDLRFCHHAGKWYVWTGSRWDKEETKLAFHWARDLCRVLNPNSEYKLAKAATAASVERFAQADRTFAVTSEIWDADPFLLGTPGGGVDLRTGALRPADRSDFITRQTAVAPDGNGSHTLWSRFLEEATLGDRDLQRFLQQVAGYCLTGDTREHALFFVYRPQFKLVIVGNHKPVLRNVDAAARRRFNIIPFVHTPAAPDKTLEARLVDEWPAILAWAIAGAVDWQENGLLRPAVVASATDEYFTEQDLIRQWVAECCDTGGRNLSDTTAHLFADWSSYALANGEKPGTTKWFSQILQRHGYEPVADTPGHRKKRGFLGISVKPVDTSTQWPNRMED